VVPVPLMTRDGDLPVDLAAVFRETYRRAAYDRLVRYATPPTLPLGRDELAWIAETARAGARA
jgi:hypothetical protein